MLQLQRVPLFKATNNTNHAPNRSIKVTTVAPHSQTLQGTLFTACPKLNIIAINTAPAPPNPSSTLSNQPGDYHIIPIQHISSFDIVSLDPNAAKQTAATVQPPIAPVDIKKLREREEAKIRQLREQEANKGKGVSREAQQIFDALKRLCVAASFYLSCHSHANSYNTGSLPAGTDRRLSSAMP